MSKAHRRRLLLAIITTIVGLLSLLLGHLPPLQQTELAAYDWRCRSWAPTFAEPAACLVLIDDATLLDFQENPDLGIKWPFARLVYHPVLSWLEEAGAKAVIFDLLFVDQDPFDEPFAAALRDHGQALLAYTCSNDSTGKELPWPVAVTGSNWWGSQEAAVMAPTDQLAAVAAGGGHIDLDADVDGTLRRIRLLRQVDEQWSPALAFATWLRVSGNENLQLTGDGVQTDRFLIPLDAEGRCLVPWRPKDQDFDRFSFKDVFVAGWALQNGKQADLDPAPFKDKVVFIGLSAEGTYDLRSTPITNKDPGVRLHASAYDALARGSFIQRVSGWATVLLATVALAAVAFVTTFSPRLTLQLAVGAIVLVAWVIGAGVAFQSGWWLPMTGPILALLCTFTCGALLNYANEGRARRQIRHIFNHYLAPELIEELVKDPNALRLGGERRGITAFFTDLAGFTTLSEGMEPVELVDFLNEYLTAMTDIILEEGGYIDKYEGDTIIAIFGAPFEKSNHAAQACRAALRCQQKLAELNRTWGDLGRQELHMRIGINSGPAVVGNVGSNKRYDYTMIGDTVNLAARLEGANKQYGTYTMASASTWEMAAGAVEGRELDLVAVKGKTLGVQVFELNALAGNLATGNSERNTAFAAALQRYRAQDFVAAEAAFAAVAEAHDDACSQIYVERCRQLAQDPPAADWDGVFRLTSK